MVERESYGSKKLLISQKVVSACLRLRGGDLGSERRRQPRPASPGSVRQWANIRHQSSVPTRDAGMGIE